MKKAGSDQVTDSEKQTLLTPLKEHGDTSGETGTDSFNSSTQDPQH